MNKVALVIDYYLDHIECGETPGNAAKRAESMIDYIYSDRYPDKGEATGREREIAQDIIKRLSAIVYTFD